MSPSLDTKTNRLRELDFLRGAAIILVLFRHTELFAITTNIGWIGVDLFFVLSGFLVSGLLFKEYLTHGNIEPKRFLIRRGFKIYPIYFIFYIPYLILLADDLKPIGILADLTFTQNYVWGWGYAYVASWSLAVEEHFYFALSIALWWSFKIKPTLLHKSSQHRTQASSFEKVIFAFLAACLVLRLFTNLAFPSNGGRNFTMTHLRIDSLLAGVYIAYLYHFRQELLRSFFSRYRYVLYLIAAGAVAWTPFIDPIQSFFAKTVGFSFLYIAFSIVLLAFLLEPTINKHLNRIFGRATVNIVSRIGYCSYSIYVIHTFINMVFDRFLISQPTVVNPYLQFALKFCLSVAVGMVMTYQIEDYFLRIRNKCFPARA